jgi:DNA-directed RNA polymerase specialized sigma24 family protein
LTKIAGQFPTLVSAMSANPNTNPTIFLRLNQTDAAPREMAWNEFYHRYAPIVAGFARRLGAAQQDVDDLIQEVLLGFFATSPTFVYDPAKGRFRGYLKVCTYRALSRKKNAAYKIQGRPLDGHLGTTAAADGAGRGARVDGRQQDVPGVRALRRL